MNLVIVESPSKCKKIEQYLSQGLGINKYKCIASFGHIYHLTSLSSINMETFETKYELDSKKKKQIDFLRKEIKQAKSVILATDDDNAGEFIAWSICKEFSLLPETTKRILFHEITESAIMYAMSHSTRINMNVVYAEKTRQIVDMLIGYTITPLLWKNISANQENSLSAGRCQTPALKMVWDHYNNTLLNDDKNEIKVHGYFSSKNIRYDLNKVFTTNEEVLSFLEISKTSKYIFERENPGQVYKKMPQPFTTSRLQQAASNEMHLSPKETMKICQTLYEGGYITYMRTDCAKYSAEFVDVVKLYILQMYLENKYINPKIDELIIKESESFPNQVLNQVPSPSQVSSPSQVNAHEAIRPTNIYLKELEDNDLTSREKRMYKLIWETSLESCMSEAEYFSLKTKIQMNNKEECKDAVKEECKDEEKYEYKNTSEQVIFLGWQIVKNKKDAKDSKEIKDYNYLLQLPHNSEITYKKISTSFSLKTGKGHYTEARLIHLLEENGIGRPSTYASIIDKIQERKYVLKQDIPGKEIEVINYELIHKKINEIKEKQLFGQERNKLVIQPLGLMVMNYLDENIDELFEYEYTKKMEIELDKICSGENVWTTICATCLKDINDQMKIEKDKKKTRQKGIKIDEDNVFIIGKYGPVIKSKDEDGKVIFKAIKDDILQDGSLKDRIKEGIQIEDVVKENVVKENVIEYKGTYLDKEFILKKGKYGLYAQWNNTNISLSCLGNRPLENIKIEEVIRILETKPGTTGTNAGTGTISIKRNINSHLSIRVGKFGDYIFYKTEKMTKPQFLKLQGYKGDYNTCDISLLQSWIREKYGIE